MSPSNTPTDNDLVQIRIMLNAPMENDNKDTENPRIQNQHLATPFNLIKIKCTNDLGSFLKSIAEGIHNVPGWNLYRFDYHLGDEYFLYRREGNATTLWIHDFPMRYQPGPNGTAVNLQDGQKVTDRTFADVIKQLKANAIKNEKGEFIIEGYLLQVRMSGRECWGRKERPSGLSETFSEWARLTFRSE